MRSDTIRILEAPGRFNTRTLDVRNRQIFKNSWSLGGKSSFDTDHLEQVVVFFVVKVTRVVGFIESVYGGKLVVVCFFGLGLVVFTAE